MTAYDVQVDGLTAIVPSGAGFRLRQADARCPGRVRESGEYPSRVDALAGLVGGAVRWGSWVRLELRGGM
jgi:hypothetical protein